MKISLIKCISKNFTDACVMKQRIKTKKYFCKCCLQCFSSEKFLIERKENGKQSVKLKSGSIGFKNYFKQLPVFFFIYADVVCILKTVEISSKNNGSYTEKYQDHVPCSFDYKVVCIDNRFSKKVVFCRGKDTVYRFIEAILKEYDYCQKNDKKAFQ